MSTRKSSGKQSKISRRIVRLSESKATGLGYSGDKKDMRFVIAKVGHEINADGKLIIEQILKGEERKGNNVRNNEIRKDTIGITAAELLVISKIIIKSTKQGLAHRLTKTKNTNLSTASSSNMSKVSSREVLKNIIKLDISNPTLMNPLKHCVYFLEGILNEKRNFENNAPIICKLRLMDSQVVSPEEIMKELTELGVVAPESNA